VARSVDVSVFEVSLEADHNPLELPIVSNLAAARETGRGHVSGAAGVDVGRARNIEAVAGSRRPRDGFIAADDAEVGARIPPGPVNVGGKGRQSIQRQPYVGRLDRSPQAASAPASTTTLDTSIFLFFARRKPTGVEDFILCRFARY
jgi:hypothetical protein